MGPNEVAYKPVINFGGYRVGTDGSVWSSLRGVWRKLKPWLTTKGRAMVDLMKDGKPHHRQVHRIVLEAFVGPCPEGMECCHDPDHNPLNNAIVNLRWGTPKENQADSVKHGTKPRGEKSPRSVITESEAREVKRLLDLRKKAKEIVSTVGGRLTVHIVYAIKRGRIWEWVAKEKGGAT